LIWSSYLDVPLLHDEPAFLSGEGVLQPVSQEELERHRLAELVRSGPASSGVHATQFVQHPGLGGCQALKVLLRTANHGCGLLKLAISCYDLGQLRKKDV